VFGVEFRKSFNTENTLKAFDKRLKVELLRNASVSDACFLALERRRLTYHANEISAQA
jgi:hypothetical protein